MNENITKYLISPLITGAFLALIYRLDFRYESITRIIIIFFVGFMIGLMSNLFAELISNFRGE